MSIKKQSPVTFFITDNKKMYRNTYFDYKESSNGIISFFDERTFLILEKNIPFQTNPLKLTGQIIEKCAFIIGNLLK